MSLEQALAANTAAIKELIATLKSNTPVAATAPEPAKKETKVNKAEPTDAEIDAQLKPLPAEDMPTKVIPYSEVSKLVLDKAKTHKKQVLEIIASFGAKSARDLTPDQYEAFVGKLNELKD